MGYTRRLWQKPAVSRVKSNGDECSGHLGSTAAGGRIHHPGNQCGFLSAYDTEKRLQTQGLEPKFNVESLAIEAGPSYFDSAVKQVGEGIDSVTAELAKRNSAPYCSSLK